MPRMVKCAKLGQELPGIVYKPFNNELGQTWMMWVEFSKKIVNEYRLDLTSASGQNILLEQADRFFFGDGGQTPPEYVAPKT
jgi:Fe-S cluster biosynthesis and repair protein YggX